MRSRRFPAVIAAVFLLAGCASGEPAGSAAPDAEESATDEPKERDRPDGESRTARRKLRPGAEAGGSGPRGGGASAEEGTEEGAEDDGSSAFAPGAGTYIYSQSGSEEFCDASSCERKELPPTQDVETTHERRSEDEVVVVTRADSSTSRSTTTTTRYTRAGGLITNVRVRFAYEGFRFDNSYQPDPPVESLRYPLRKGSRWTGSWDDSTSGRYTISVGGPTSVTVGSMTVQAYPVRTETTFEGEFDGSADVTTWIDPATAAIVKLEGEIDVKSVFGRYSSEFAATLRSGPGY